MKTSFRFIAVILITSIISTFGVSISNAADTTRQTATEKAATRQIVLLQKIADRALERAKTSPTLKNQAAAREALAAVTNLAPVPEADNSSGSPEVANPNVYPILVLKAGLDDIAQRIKEGSLDPVTLTALKSAYADASKIYSEAKAVHIAKLKADFDAASLAFKAAGGGSGNERGSLMGVGYRKYMAELAYLLAVKYL